MDTGRAYATLGLTRSATRGEVRQAYRARLQRLHPDTGAVAGAGDVEALASVTAAYHTLAAVLPRQRTAPPAPARHVDVYA